MFQQRVELSRGKLKAASIPPTHSRPILVHYTRSIETLAGMWIFFDSSAANHIDIVWSTLYFSSFVADERYREERYFSYFPLFRDLSLGLSAARPNPSHHTRTESHGD